MSFTVLSVLLLLYLMMPNFDGYEWSSEELEKQLGRIPSDHIKTLLPVMMNFENETYDFSRLHIRKSIAKHMAWIFGIFTLLGAAGLTSQMLIVTDAVDVIRSSRSMAFKRNLIYIVINSFNDFFKMVVLYAFSFIQLTHTTWPYGAFWCHALPMIQDFCFNYSTLTIFLILYNRDAMFRSIGPEPRVEASDDQYGVPPEYGVFAMVVTSAFSVAFYTVFIEFVGLDQYLGHDFKAIGICAANLNDNIPYFVQMIFFGVYMVPFVVCAKFHCNSSTILKQWHEHTHRNYQFERLSTSSDGRHRLDIVRMVKGELRRQQMFKRFYYTLMICLAPINCLRLIKHTNIETLDQLVTYDVLYLAAVGIQFLPLVFNAIYFHLNKAKERNIREPENCERNSDDEDRVAELEMSPQTV